MAVYGNWLMGLERLRTTIIDRNVLGSVLEKYCCMTYNGGILPSTRRIVVALCFVSVCGLLVVGVSAAEPSQQDEIVYEQSSNETDDTVVFESGSISGDITTGEERLPNTFVWTDEFVTQNDTTFNISPDFEATDDLDEFGDIESDEDVENLRFTVQVLETDADTDSVIEERTATGDDLREIDLDAKLETVDAPDEDEFNLLRHAGDHDGTYSMENVPAQEFENQTSDDRDGVEYTSLAGVQYTDDDRGFGESANPVRPNITQEGDIVLIGATPIEDPNSDYANEDGEVDTDGLRTAIDDWRNEEITTDDLREVIDAWRNA